VKGFIDFVLGNTPSDKGGIEMNATLFRTLADISMDLYELMEILGILLRSVGAVAFGLGIGWLAIQAIRMRTWQFAVASILGLLAAFVLVGRWIPSPGTLGGYGLGLGIAVVIWGVGRVPQEENPK
jgi:hypothetical protein